MLPIIKGTIRKKPPIPPNPVVIAQEAKTEVKEVASDFENLKTEITGKIEAVEQKVIDTTTSLEERTTEAIKGVEILSEKVNEVILNIKDGENGKDGISPEIDYQGIIDEVLNKIPEPEKPDIEKIVKEVLIKIPKQEIDLKKLRNSILKSLPAKKGDLKIITEKVEIDPMSVIEKIMELPADKFKLKLDQIDGLDQTINSFRSQLSRGYLHGGGDTIKAGDGIAIVSNNDGTKTVSAPGSTTDEKVKLSALDPTAGYLNDKLSASDGIAYNNGAFTNTDKGSDVDLSGYVPYISNVDLRVALGGIVDDTTTTLQVAPQTYTVNDPAGGSYNLIAGTLLPQSGTATYIFTIYAYREIDGSRVYSKNPIVINTGAISTDPWEVPTTVCYDDEDCSLFGQCDLRAGSQAENKCIETSGGGPVYYYGVSIELNWTASSNADGYKVVLSDTNAGYTDNYYIDVATNSLVYDFYEQTLATAESPIVITPTTIYGKSIRTTGNIESTAFITTGGFSTDFVKGDGSLDSSTYLTAETDPLSLHLDQTTPQTVANGQPTFSSGLVSGNATANFNLSSKVMGGITYPLITGTNSAGNKLSYMEGGLYLLATATQTPKLYFTDPSLGFTNYIISDSDSKSNNYGQMRIGARNKVNSELYSDIKITGAGTQNGWIDFGEEALKNIDGINIVKGYYTTDWSEAYGLKIEDVDEIDTDNYAIKTGLGKVSFGDNLLIGATTDDGMKLQVASSTDGWLARFAGNVDNITQGYSGILIGNGPFHEGMVKYYDDDDISERKFGFGIGGDAYDSVKVWEGGTVTIQDASSDTGRTDAPIILNGTSGGAIFYGSGTVLVGTYDPTSYVLGGTPKINVYSENDATGVTSAIQGESLTTASGGLGIGVIANAQASGDEALTGVAGIYGGAYSTNTVGMDILIGLYYEVQSVGSGSFVADMAGARIGMYADASDIGSLYGLDISVIKNSGTIESSIGVNIGDIPAGTVSTYSIKTGIGDAYFGDDVIISKDNDKLWFGTGKDMSVYYDGTSGYIKTSDIAASDLHITCGTDKTLVLDETVYDDMQFPIATGKVPAANFPTWETFTTNTEAYAFSVDDKIQLGANEPSHGWKEGTNGSAHIHFAIKTAQNTGANRFAKFELIFACSDYNGTWTEQAAITAEQTIPTGSAALKSFLLTIGTVTLTGLHLGSQVRCRVRRIAATGGTEYADDVYITQVGVHIELERIGSRTLSAA